jgi:hypothetical protein
MFLIQAVYLSQIKRHFQRHLIKLIEQEGEIQNLIFRRGQVLIRFKNGKLGSANITMEPTLLLESEIKEDTHEDI